VRGKYRSIALFVAVNLISVACLVWALHGFNLRRLFYQTAHLDWRWVSVAILSNILMYVVQAWRWSLVLAPVKAIPVWQSARAIYVGLYANEVLPLRSGEIIRCYLQALWSDIPISVALASALIERIFDGIWLIGALFFAIERVPLPRFIRTGGLSLAAVVLVTAILLAIAMFWKEQTLDALLNAPRFSWVHTLIQDLHLIGHSRYLYFAFLVSLPCMLLQMVPIYAVLRASQEVHKLPLMVSFALMLALRLNSVLPQAPGNVGTFQIVASRGMMRFGVGREIAQDLSFIMWGIVTLPLVVVGFVAVALTGLKIGELQRHARTSMRDRDSVPEDPALKE
jgi:hypothetical protein